LIDEGRKATETVNALKVVRQRYRDIWRKLGRERPPYPLNVAVRHDGSYHVEFADGEYRYIASDDRGTYVDLKSTRDLRQLMEWIEIQVAYQLTSPEHRRLAGNWSHAEWIAYHLAQLAKIDPVWAERRRVELEAPAPAPRPKKAP
jgi:hypothetical protein